MAEIKKVNDITLDENLTLIANAIRTKLETTGSLSFPNNFETEINKTYLLDDLVSHSITGAVYMYGDRIRVNAFSNSNITEIHAPNATQFYSAVTAAETGFASFMNCTQLSVVDLPKLHYVNNNGYQFAGCTSLTEVELPELTTVGQYMFNGCTNLKSFSGPLVTSINQYSFANDTKLESENFYTPLATKISTYTFYNCKKITSLPSAVIQTIGNYSFKGSGITGDLVLNDLQTIGINAFQSLTGISSISFPSATSVGDLAFDGCKGITSINLPTVTTIGAYAFRDNIKLTTVSLPVVKTIGNYGFQTCTGLTSVSIPTATSVGSYCFDGCKSITSVCAPLVKTVNNYAFRNCASLTSIEFPQATTFGGRALQSCTGITTTMSFPLVTSVGDYGLNACTQTPAINLPKVTSLATGVFSNNYLCASYNLPAVTTIYASAFNNNRELQTLVLRKVTTISGASSFNGCSKLKTIDMGPSSTNLSGTTIFNNCSVLDTVIIRRIDVIAPLANINSFSGTPFAEGGSGGTIYVPQALLSTYESATNWSTLLSYVDANEQPQNIILPLEGSQYEYYYADGQAMPYPVTFDTIRTVSSSSNNLIAFSPTNTATTIYAQNEYNNSFNFAPFSASDFDVTITMKDQDITSTAYSVTNNIGTIYIEHILGPIVITIKFKETIQTGTELFVGASTVNSTTRGTITTPGDGWRTITSTGTANWGLTITYKGAANLFKQMNALYNHYIRVDLNVEWLQTISGALYYVTPGGYISITGTPSRRSYESFTLSNGQNFNNSIIFKLPNDKNSWDHVNSGVTPLDTDYFSATHYLYSNKNGSIKINSINFYDLGTMEPETI